MTVSYSLEHPIFKIRRSKKNGKFFVFYDKLSVTHPIAVIEETDRGFTFSCFKETTKIHENTVPQSHKKCLEDIQSYFKLY